MNMGIILLIKKIALFFLLVSASLLSTSLAGRQSMFVNNLLAKEMGAVQEEVSEEQLRQETEVTTLIHERILKVNTQDYGNYDPAPALVKPPFKLIPN